VGEAFPDKQYRKKVYEMLRDNTTDIELSDRAVEIFEKRKAENWNGANTIYDLWLLGMQEPRDWFPVEVFEVEYPDYLDLVNNIAPTDSENSSTCDVQVGQSEHQPQRKRRKSSAHRFSTTTEGSSSEEDEQIKTQNSTTKRTKFVSNKT